MTQVFIITEREDLARSIGRYLRFREGIEVSYILPPPLPRALSDAELEKLSPSLRQYQIDKAQWVPQTFSKLAEWLENKAQQGQGDSSLFEAIAIIDLPSLTSLNQLDPIDRTKDWPAVVSMLLLTFPEVHWVLVSPYVPPDEESLLRRAHFPQAASFFEDLEVILHLHHEGYSPLFDPAGLRNTIRRTIALRPDASYVPLRKDCAAAIDEERSYSYFNAYTAYRFGFRAHVIATDGMMRIVLEKEEVPDLAVTFEDIYLNFPDKRKRLSNIRTRDEEFKALLKVPKRIFVTGGHTLTLAEQETWKHNEVYLKSRQSEGFYTRVLYKPETGVFDIWRRCGLQQKLTTNGGKAEGFKWPPAKALTKSDIGGTHSAPGRLLLISELLIRRAGRILKNAESMPESIHGSTLALEAQEYLGHRTPTTSLDAVSLKHQLEVLAECMFYGVEYHLDTKSRFKEIEEEVEAIGVWFRSRTREISTLNAEIGILSELLLSFRNFNQFNEEQAALSKVRHLHRRLWFKRNQSWAWVLYLPRWYFDQLLGSLPIFIAAIIGWLSIFALFFSLIQHDHKQAVSEYLYMHGFEDAITSFFGMQPPHDLSTLESTPFFIWVCMVVIVMSFVHLGIFVSHLYSLIARR